MQGSIRLGRLYRDPIVLSLAFVLLVSVVFLAFPGIDLWFSGLFYAPGRGFVLHNDPLLERIRALGNDLVIVIALALGASLIAKLAWPGRASIIPPNISVFLLAGLALGPGLLVNVVLKDHWGRPRPRMVEAFGGSEPYVVVWRVSDHCARNCSFVSGEASSAAWLLAFVFLVPPPARKPAAIVIGLFAAALSLNRVAFGGHFLSDTLMAWGLTLFVVANLHRLFVAAPPRGFGRAEIEEGLTQRGEAIRRLFVRRGS